MIRARTAQVLTIDGYAVSINVDRGHLVVADGVADERRERHLYRSDRDCKRIVVLSSHGTLSLSALQWCADVGVAVVVLDPVEDRILSISAASERRWWRRWISDREAAA
jgi:hypothetical protein